MAAGRSMKIETVWYRLEPAEIFSEKNACGGTA